MSKCCIWERSNFLVCLLGCLLPCRLKVWLCIWPNQVIILCYFIAFILSAASLDRKPQGSVVHRPQIRDLEGKRTKGGFLDSWDEEHFPLKEITSDKVASLPFQDALRIVLSYFGRSHQCGLSSTLGESKEERTFRNWMNSLGVNPYINHLYR